MGRGGEPGASVDLSGCFGDVWALSDDERTTALRVVGRPTELTAAAQLAALPEWTRWRETILAHLATAQSEHDVARVLAGARQELAEDEAIAASLYETTMHASMAGQLFVRAVEVPEVDSGASDGLVPAHSGRVHDVNVDGPTAHEKVVGLRTSVLPGAHSDGNAAAAKLAIARDKVDGLSRAHAPRGCHIALDARDSRPSFFRLNFREALESFLARDLITAEEFQALSAEARSSSWSATRLASQHLVERAHALLARHLEEGGTLRGFINAMEEGSVVLGIEPNPPDRTPATWYLETVYRTTTQQAYGQGRLKQLQSPAVRAARPFVQYRTAGDNRVRSSHAALHGVVFDRSTDGGWERFAPPLGFNCRCSLVTVRAGRFDESTIRNSAELLAEGLGPDDGWSGPGG